MRLNELPTSDRIEDRRRVPGGRAGIGMGTVVILGLIGWALGIDPRVLIGGAEILSGSGETQQQTEAGSTGAPSDEMGHFVSAILGSTEVEWKDVFAQAGKTYQPPTLVMFSGSTQSACGFAQAAMGPFYCPNDQKVYLDTSFFQDLERRFSRLRCRQQDLPVFTSLCDCPRDWPSRSKPAWTIDQSAGGAAWHGEGRRECTAGPSGTTSGLPCRRLGEPCSSEMAIHRTR